MTDETATQETPGELSDIVQVRFGGVDTPWTRLARDTAKVLLIDRDPENESGFRVSSKLQMGTDADAPWAMHIEFFGHSPSGEPGRGTLLIEKDAALWLAYQIAEMFGGTEEEGRIVPVRPIEVAKGAGKIEIVRG